MPNPEITVERVINALPDPDQIGASEYRTIRELIDDALAGYQDDAGLDAREFALAVLDELDGWTVKVRKIIDALGSPRPDPEYALPDEVVAIRLYKEEGVGSGGDWAIDGIDGADKYTEACWSFDTEQAAREAIPEFCQNHGISTNLPVVTINDEKEG